MSSADTAYQGRWPFALRALNHRNYRLFMSGQVVAMVGTWVQSVAQAWLIYRLTDSPALLGLVAFLGQLPIFLFALVGGAVADRYPRRAILFVTQVLSMSLALVLAALALGGWVQAWHVFALALLLGMVNAVDIPTRQAFVADVVERVDLANAIALNSSAVTAARIAGPAVAGLLIASLGEGWCFLLNGLSYLVVIVSLLAIRLPASAPAPRAGSALGQIVEGARFALHQRPVRDLLLLLGLVSLMGVPYMTLMPIFAERVLLGGPNALGLLLAAGGAGSLIGAICLTVRSDMRGLGALVGWSAAALGIALVLFVCSRHFWLSMVLLLPVGAAMMLGMAATQTLIQAMVPDALRGRVTGLYSMMFIGMTAFGSLLSGVLAERFGAPLALGLGGAACLLGGLLFLWRLPALKADARALVASAGGQPLQPES